MDRPELGGLFVGEVQRFLNVHAFALLLAPVFGAGHAALGFASTLPATLLGVLRLAGIFLLAVVAIAERLADGLTVNAVALTALTTLAAHRVGCALTSLVALSLGERRGVERAGD